MPSLKMRGTNTEKASSGYTVGTYRTATPAGSTEMAVAPLLWDLGRLLHKRQAYTLALVGSLAEINLRA